MLVQYASSWVINWLLSKDFDQTVATYPAKLNIVYNLLFILFRLRSINFITLLLSGY